MNDDAWSCKCHLRGYSVLHQLVLPFISILSSSLLMGSYYFNLGGFYKLGLGSYFQGYDFFSISCISLIMHCRSFSREQEIVISEILLLFQLDLSHRKLLSGGGQMVPTRIIWWWPKMQCFRKECWGARTRPVP